MTKAELQRGRKNKARSTLVSPAATTPTSTYSVQHTKQPLRRSGRPRRLKSVGRPADPVLSYVFISYRIRYVFKNLKGEIDCLLSLFLASEPADLNASIVRPPEGDLELAATVVFGAYLKVLID